MCLSLLCQPTYGESVISWFEIAHELHIYLRFQFDLPLTFDTRFWEFKPKQEESGVYRFLARSQAQRQKDDFHKSLLPNRHQVKTNLSEPTRFKMYCSWKITKNLPKAKAKHRSTGGRPSRTKPQNMAVAGLLMGRISDWWETDR